MSTGLAGLDGVLLNLRGGDNVVWEVDNVRDYVPFLEPYVKEARRLGRRLIYFRFARHEPLLDESSGAQICVVDPEEGFERFLSTILDIIESAGLGAFYVFDCLSDLAADWFSDRMLGNFFMIACPYLYDMDTIAYFALLKNRHSSHAIQSIGNTAQVIIEVHRRDQEFYVHPLKVWQRQSPTMYMLHQWVEDEFRPVLSSATITDILASVAKPWLDFAVHRPGIWMTAFQDAQETARALHQGRPADEHARELFHRLLKMVVTRDERFLGMAENYFSLESVVEIMERMVGTGLIGGKALGMLLARAILCKADPSWRERLEGHDSFFVGSDVFYTYLVQNGCWWLRRRQKDFDRYLKGAAEARAKILQGSFPEQIEAQFEEMLEYFGQSPLIVRSSSLLEDNYGNAFSGKYDSVFLANQGTPQQRLQAFLDAVRTVYASAMSEAGLEYRRQHGLLERDEQMALLVQRVSGELQGNLFFPHAAGVGFSFNPFAWDREIDPKAGVLRMVFGLGTRAVDRTEDDYARLVSLNAPHRRTEGSTDEARQFAQRRVDVLDLARNQLITLDLNEAMSRLPAELVALFEEPGAESRDSDPAKFLSMDRLLADTTFVQTMRELCQVIQSAYAHPVDIEFTANFSANGRFRINLVQCRPFHAKILGEASRSRIPEQLTPQQVFFESKGPIVGHSLACVIHRVIYVVPSIYGQLSTSKRYSVARTIGRLVNLEPQSASSRLLLMGPGRWGTSMPWLGVPVSFAEISKVSVLCELAVMHAGLIPEVSLGTHFFNDLVEMDMLYVGVLPGKPGHILREDLLCRSRNLLTTLLPAAGEWEQAIWVVDTGTDGVPPLCLNVDAMRQSALCFWENSVGDTTSS